MKQNIGVKMKYIAIEGLDGCGKDTQIDLIKEQQPDLIHLREPSERIRKAVQQETYINPVARSLELMADRAETYSLLDPSESYVTNRSIISGYGYTRGILDADFDRMSAIANAPEIDMAILLYMDTDIFNERNNNKEKDSIESNSVQWHMDTQSRMLRYTTRLDLQVAIIYAGLSKEHINKTIMKLLGTLK